MSQRTSHRRRDQGNWLARHPEVHAALPDHDTKWVCSKYVPDRERAPEVVREQIRYLRDNDIVDVVGRAERSPEAGGGKINLYRTPKCVAESAPDREDLAAMPGPCPHTGVRNLGGGEFTCTDEDCDVRFGRDVAEEVVRHA